ncbi:glycosyltransferase [Pseudactinotalea suaedae]|uniref:glycosyltransferase n=1 Tax=Pseudactinotalea suaedae TaxID=1524924 RepID=UPI0012E2DDCB|nr:glycosyltransferase [Pseudactinotalea suaedae]
MRIVAVTTWFPTDRAPGTGVFVAQDVAAIAAHPEVTAVEVVHLVAPRLHDGVALTEHQGIRVRRVPMNPLDPLDIIRVARTLPRLLAGADVVHSMAMSSLAPLVVARVGTPWLHTEHWSGLTNPRTVVLPLRPAVGLVKLLLRAPQTVTAVCDYLARPIRRARYPRRTATIGCIVPPREHVTGRPLRPAEELRLVAVGGLVERKDPLLAVRTIAELRDRGVPARLIWVGGGPLARKVTRLARRLRVSEVVELAGPQDPAGVTAALEAADMFVLPTRGDNFCVSAAEALVHGRPVVVGATGGQGEYIDPAVGTLVGEQTPQAYADAITDLHRRTQHLTAAEIAATIGDRFAPVRIAEGYVAEYRHLLRSR